VLGVEFDPELVSSLRAKGMNVSFGDGQDADFLESLPLEGVPWAVSTLPDLDSNRALLHALTVRGFAGEVAFVARDDTQGALLKLAGAPTVLYPFRDAVDFTVERMAALIKTEKEST
jgi:Trk K+ transport system NAD-binding subunit